MVDVHIDVELERSGWNERSLASGGIWVPALISLHSVDRFDNHGVAVLVLQDDLPSDVELISGSVGEV